MKGGTHPFQSADPIYNRKNLNWQFLSKKYKSLTNKKSS
ncbi:Uncharacterized protein dnm_055910 [Desulfonema magnum]|uniref:Uncharacterized protein n=1 Tax=Desulfonema magnum TaxID=45655 RepID=A0A975GQ56_9BACT|nr:Uncharacterized protein dnm_055910 [Desulfonema magnum]